MARGRMVSQTVATDKKLNELSTEAELLYLKAIPHLDRDGLILGEPMLFWAQVCPRRPELMPKMSDLIDELISSGLVISYQDDDDTILFFTGFTKNQIGLRYERESASRFGPPPGYIRTHSGLVASDTASNPQPRQPTEATPQNEREPTPSELRTSSGQAPDSVPHKLREVNRREVEVEGTDIAPNAHQQRQKPMSEKQTATHFDARQLDKAGLLEKGVGTTQIEIWRESFAWTPTAAQIRDMNERVTDLDRWRQVTNECAIKAFRSYKNVIDVYLNGWRDSPDTAAKSKTVTGNIGINLAAI